MTPRRKVMAVVGNGGDIPIPVAALARSLGRAAVDSGFRIVTGGLGGVMAAVSEGARGGERYTEGDIIGVLPGYDRAAANPWVDVVIPTGMQLARNVVVVSMADVVVAVGGGAGTLSEVALAWQLGRPVIALLGANGWAEDLAGRTLDHRHAEPIATARSVDEVIELALRATEVLRPEPGDVGSGWRGGAR